MKEIKKNVWSVGEISQGRKIINETFSDSNVEGLNVHFYGKETQLSKIKNLVLYNYGGYTVPKHIVVFTNVIDSPNGRHVYTTREFKKEFIFTDN